MLVPLGLLKLTKGKSLAGNAGMLWMHDFSPRAVSAIGVAEIIAGGLMLAGSLVPSKWASLAGGGAALVILSGAIHTHSRRKERGAMVLPAVLAAASLGAIVLL